MKPSQILSKLCKEGKIDPPVYNRGKVTVGKHNFVIKQEEIDQCDFSKGTIIIIHPSPPLPSPGKENIFLSFKNFNRDRRTSGSFHFTKMAGNTKDRLSVGTGTHRNETAL